jgi:hypothetical protein
MKLLIMFLGLWVLGKFQLPGNKNLQGLGFEGFLLDLTLEENVIQCYLRTSGPGAGPGLSAPLPSLHPSIIPL